MIYAECCERGGCEVILLDGGKWVISFDDRDFTYPISFCPFCGKKLGGETLTEFCNRITLEAASFAGRACIEMDSTASPKEEP